MEQSLSILPNIETILMGDEYEHGLEWILNNVDIAGAHINVETLEALPKSDTVYKCLSQIYFQRKIYQKSIENALNCNFRMEDDFYSKSIHFHMIERYLNGDDNPKLVDYVEKLSKDIFSVGFLIDSGQFDLLQQTLGPMEFLGVLEYLDKKKGYELLLKYDIVMDKKFVRTYGDALIFSGQIDKIEHLLNELELNLAYDLCFYLSETHGSIAKGIFTKNENFNKILTGTFKSEILLKKLIENTTGDYVYLQQFAKAGGKGTLSNLCLPLANTIMHIGSTNDTFMRTNVEFFTQNRGWLKFISHALIGGIHYSNEKIMDVLENFFPTEKDSSNGGALFALGLAKASTDTKEFISFLYNYLDVESDVDPEVTYGAILGLGSLLMESNNKKVVKDLLEILETNDGLLGEGAALAIGQIQLGSHDHDTLESFHNILLNTEKERLARSIAIGNALISLQKEDASAVVLLPDSSENVRYYGILSLGASFAGTGNTEILSDLLKAIDDSNNEIKRIAVIAVGLVCANDQDMLLDLLEPLSLSYSPFVKSAVALVLGFFFCATGNKKVINIVEVLMHDEHFLVQQSAYIGMGFLLMQMNSKLIPNYKRIVDEINNKVVHKHGETCSRLGAFIGRSLIESANGNVIFSTKNMCGKLDKNRLGAFILFSHYWYWYPLLPYIILLCKPTFLMLLDKNLEEIKDSVIFPGAENNYELTKIGLPEIKKKRKYVKRLKTEIENEKEKICEESFQSEGEYAKNNGLMKEKERIDGGYDSYFYFL
ncbi:RPN2 26S proteasome regulatory complex component [Spraguea lophii 42_110]|uniref:RPN2 26S proteasome regulatory complex component n=1 Tax=Spraguea lophii (strain 42_110) TaxID=1358809 RepID=S7W6M1_SPRLO|nr:RPN2 26S proteasome regulatory complex component [Spraguea lophii 42_110]